MSEENLLQQILEANRSFLGGNVRLLAESENPLVVIACIDRRLTGLIEPALGLSRNRAAVIRTAGNQVSDRNRDVLRSVAACLFAQGAREVFVVGHTDCVMAHFSAADVAESFRRAGVPREAFGAEDLRTWFGALSNERTNVVDSVAALRRSAFVPASIKVHGLIMDTASGAVEVLVDGNLGPASAAAKILAPEAAVSASRERPAMEFATAPSTQAPIPALPQTEAEPARKPVVIDASEHPLSAAESAQTPKTYVDAMLHLRQALGVARQNPKMRRLLSDLAQAIEQERDPARVFAVLQRLERECAPLYPQITPALEVLKRSLQTRKGALNFMDMMRRLLD